VTDPLLPLLLAIIVALFAVGALAAALPDKMRQVTGFAAAAISGVGCLLSLMSLLTANEPAGIELPIGPPGTALHLAIDPLSAFYLLFVLLAATAGLAFAAENTRTDPSATLAGPTTGIAGLALTLLAADGPAVALGLALAGGALWATGGPGRPRAVQLAVVLAAGMLAMTAVDLLSDPDTPARFASVRSTPLGLRSTVVLALALLGAGGLCGLFPLHAWLIPAHTAAPSRGAAVLSGGVVPVAIYLLLRLTVDLAGHTPPLWWGLPFLLMGAASAMMGPWRGATGANTDGILAAAVHRSAGLAAIGIGLLLAGRAADLPNLAALALAGVLLLSAGQALCGTLVMLAAGAVQQGAGSRQLDRLGGLIHRMPATAIGMATGLFGLAALPFGIGFAGSWLLFQSLLAAPRIDGLAQQALLAGLVAVLALSAALAAASAVRLFGVAFLGRPRTPRAAAADDVAGPARPALLALAGIAALSGLLPGVVLWLFADPTIQRLAGISLGPRAGLLSLAPGSETPGYAALPLAALVALCVGIPVWLLRHYARPERRSPAWHDGFARPPAWLPFGDPLAQSDGTGFVPELPRPAERRIRPGWLVSAYAVAVPVAGLWAVLAIIVALLVALAILGPT
jgi:formate hydrogenlyase subunit 3/multisubunit Na+/H+ antiporter MnhD subunit